MHWYAGRDVFGELANPHPGDLDSNIALIHDLEDYFRYENPFDQKFYGDYTPDQRIGTVGEHPDDAASPMTDQPFGDYRHNSTPVKENNAWIHTFVHMYQIQAAEIEQLLDTIVRTGTPIGAAVGARRDDILDAFRQLGIAEISRGIQVLMQWMRDPTAEHRAPIEQLLAELQATIGASPGEVAEAEASLRRIDRSVRASLGVFGQARPTRPRRS
jgi:hypothetical protein